MVTDHLRTSRINRETGRAIQSEIRALLENENVQTSGDLFRRDPLFSADERYSDIFNHTTSARNLKCHEYTPPRM